MAYYSCKWEHLHQWHRGDPKLWAMVRLKQWHLSAWERMIRDSWEKYRITIDYVDSKGGPGRQEAEEGIRLCDEVKQKVSAYIRDATDFTPPTDWLSQVGARSGGITIMGNGQRLPKTFVALLKTTQPSIHMEGTCG